MGESGDAGRTARLLACVPILAVARCMEIKSEEAQAKRMQEEFPENVARDQAIHEVE